MVRPTSPKTIVSRIFSASQRPIYLLDASGRVVFLNSALAEWLDMDEQQLQGLQCVYSATAASSEVASCLAVPPQVAETGEYRTTIGLPGNESRRSATFYSLHDQADSTLVILDAEESEEQPPSTFDVDTLHQEVLAMREAWSQAYRLDSIVGSSPAMKRVRAQIQVAAKTSCRVVIVGNQGTGRETVARTIHREQASEQSQGHPVLVPLSCELMDAELLQSTVEAFVRQLAEQDDPVPTTLLLLDVEQLSMEAQSALLGFLEIPELGFQTMATSRSQLSDLVEQQKFRAELASHLTNLEIMLPSLTERLDDIPVVAQWMLERSSHSDRLGGFTPDAIESLLRYGWPREVTELKEVVEEAAATATGSLIGKDDLPKKLEYAADAAALPDQKVEDVNLDEFMAEVESELIARALRNAKGNRAQAARSLGISRGKLLRRIEQLGLDDA